MKSILTAAGSLTLLLLSGGAALAQETQTAAPAPASDVAPAAAPVLPAAAPAPAPSPAFPTQPVVTYEATPAATTPVVQYEAAAAPPAQQLPAGAVVARGQWVSTAENGWIWVPENATTYSVNQVPYVYLYTPTYGWTWYTSPWGPGRYTYGTWVSRPWNNGFRVWARTPTGWGWHYGPRPGVRVYAAPHVVVARPAVRTNVFIGGHVGVRSFGHGHHR